MTPTPDPGDVLTRAAPPPTRTTAYGPDLAQVYDVRLPTGMPGAHLPGPATVVVIHGGFWRAAFDRTHAASQAQAFADRDLPVAVIEYRRVGMRGGGYPGTVEDVASALAAVRRDEQLPDPVVLVGHSAGAQLALWAAAQPWSAPLAGVVSLAGCVDLTLTARLGLGGDAASAFVGGGPDEVPERYAGLDPTQLVPPRAPVRLAHGSADDRVTLEISESYRRSAARAGVDVPLDVLPGVGHFELIDPLTPAFEHSVAAVRALLAVAVGDASTQGVPDARGRGRA